MADDLGQNVAVSMLVHGVLMGDEPTAEQLTEYAEPLDEFGLRHLAGIFMGIRLAIRWFGLAAIPCNGGIERHGTIAGALTINLQVPKELLPYVEWGLRECGFEQVDHQYVLGATYCQLRFTAPPDVVMRYGAVVPPS